MNDKLQSICLCVLTCVFILCLLMPTVSGNDATFTGVVLDIDYDFDNDKTVIFLDNHTIIVDGIHTEFVIGVEYDITVSGTTLVDYNEVKKDDNDKEIPVGFWFVVVCVCVVIVAVFIIMAITKFKFGIDRDDSHITYTHTEKEYEEVEDSAYFCPVCGEMVKPNVSSCSECGSVFDKDDD